MKHILFLTLVFSLALAACGTSAPADASTISANTEAYVSANLDTSYENALSARLQLSLGSLKLAETVTPITSEQAKIMLPLWLGLQNMSSSGNSAQAEINALLAQIESAFTPDQLSAIRAMKLSSTDIQTWAAANNVTSGSGQPGTGQGGGSGMSPEARATKQAAEGVTPGSGGNGVSTVMLNTLIAHLQGLSQ